MQIITLYVKKSTALNRKGERYGQRQDYIRAYPQGRETDRPGTGAYPDPDGRCTQGRHLQIVVLKLYKRIRSYTIVFFEASIYTIVFFEV